MAASLVSRGTSVQAPANPVPVAVSGSCSSDNHMIAVVFMNNAPTLTVTDARSNTWSVHATSASGTAWRVFLCSARMTTALQSGDLITFQQSVSIQDFACILVEASGLAASSWFDKAATSSGVSTTSLTVGPTVTLTNSDEIVIAGFGVDATASANTFTPATGYSLLPGLTSAGLKTTNNFGLAAEYRLVTSTAAVTSTMTQFVSLSYAAAVATFASFMPRPPIVKLQSVNRAATH